MGSSPDWSGTVCQSFDSMAVAEENVWNHWFGGSFGWFSEGSTGPGTKAALLLLPKLIIWGSVKGLAVEKAVRLAQAGQSVFHARGAEILLRLSKPDSVSGNARDTRGRPPPPHAE